MFDFIYDEINCMATNAPIFSYPTFKLESIQFRAKSKDQSDNVRNFDE